MWPPATVRLNCALEAGSATTADRPFSPLKPGNALPKKRREEIHRSLERLQVDHVDLIQLHNLVDPLEWETALGPGGALEAAIEAREQGLVRFIGVTGHGLTAPAMHTKALERFNFDSVLLPFSYLMAQNEQYLGDFLKLISICQTRNVAMQTIKSIVHKPWEDRAAKTGTPGTARWKTRRILTWPCIGCWGIPGCS